MNTDTAEQVPNRQTLTTATNLTLGEMQMWCDAIYHDINSSSFELVDMLGRLDEYCSRVFLWIRKGEAERIDYHLCMSLAWLFAITNRLLPAESHGDIQKLLCEQCSIKLPPTTPLTTLQTALAEKHKGGKAQSAFLCLAEKVFALSSAIGKYRMTHYDTEYLPLSARRIAQSVEALLVVASICGFDLSEVYHRTFANGCPKCGRKPCGCGCRLDAVK